MSVNFGGFHEESRADDRRPRVCVRCAAGGGWPRVSVRAISAEAAARYYAEAIAQGRFEDAMGVESSELSSKVGEVPDLRRSQPSSLASVTGVVAIGDPDGDRKQTCGLR